MTKSENTGLPLERAGLERALEDEIWSLAVAEAYRRQVMQSLVGMDRRDVIAWYYRENPEMERFVNLHIDAGTFAAAISQLRNEQEAQIKKMQERPEPPPDQMNFPTFVRSHRQPSGSRLEPKEIAEALEAFFNANVTHFDENAHRLFRRLKEDERIPQTFAAVAKDVGRLNSLLLSCLQAEFLARTFSERLVKGRRTIERVNMLEKGLEGLKSFFDEVGKREDQLAGKIVLEETEIAAVRQAFSILEWTLRARRRVAEEDVLRLGATRKSAASNKKAGETAAIGWIAEAVKRIAGKPLTNDATVLAEAVLGIRDVTFDRVREALRTRDREWRRSAPWQRR